MDAGLKQRLIGAAVLVALAVIFLPMLVKGPAPDSGVSNLPMRVPDAPQDDYRTVDLPLVVPPDAPEGGVLGLPEPPAPQDDDALPTVDTANAPPPAQPAAQPAAAPARTEPMLPATTAGGDYVVHFGAFANERDAQLIVRQLAGAGLTAYSEAFALNGKPAQRVRLGPYASRAEAEAVRVRAAQVRSDVTPRVVALDAPAATPAAAAATPSSPPSTATAARPPATTPAPPAAKPAAPAPAAATPPPAATTGVGFAVQVGAFGNAEEATKLRDRLRGLGITAFTDTVATDKGRLTRVKAGPVASRADADRLMAQVKSKAGLDGIVRPHP